MKLTARLAGHSELDVVTHGTLLRGGGSGSGSGSTRFWKSREDGRTRVLHSCVHGATYMARNGDHHAPTP